MLEVLDIHGLRGIREGQLQSLGRVNLLIGPNGCGKSTILEALSILAAHYFRRDPMGEIRRDRLHKRRNEPDPAASLWYGRQPRATLGISAKFKNRTVTLNLAAQFPSGYSEQADPPQLPDPATEPAVEYLQKLLFLDAERALSRQVEESLWDATFMAGAHHELIRVFEGIYGLKLRSVTFTKGHDFLVDIEPRPLRLDDLGAGMRIAFRILIAALVTEGSALLLEEFDAYQYKTSLGRLAEALCEIAEKKRVQLFMTTHSLESVHAFLKAAESQGRPDDWVKVYPLTLSHDGVLTSKGMRRTEAQNLMTYGLDLRDITSYAKQE